MSDPKLQEKIIDALKTVQDPDLHKDIVSLGFVKNLNIEGGNIKFDVELTTPACPVKEQLRTECETKVKDIDGVEQVDVNMTAVVRSTEHSQPVLPGVKNIIAVASGKGGVGKSTVSTNLAIALSLTGARVGLMDADIYGPSIPQMMGIPISSPKVGAENKFFPHEKYGLKVVSAAFLTKQGQPLMLRGPMLGGIIQQFLQNVEWGELDVLLVDVPPGTDKISRLLELVPSLHQMLLVTTPSETSRFVVAKSVRLAREAEVGTVALVANMTGHTCPSCGHVSELFAGDGARRLQDEADVPLWADIPFDPRLGADTDAGTPLVTTDPTAPASRALFALADRVATQMEARDS